MSEATDQPQDYGSLHDSPNNIQPITSSGTEQSTSQHPIRGGVSDSSGDFHPIEDVATISQSLDVSLAVINTDDEQNLLSNADFMEEVPADIKGVNLFPDDPDFQQLIKDAESAIEAKVLPQRIAQGSSGSYFVRNVRNEVIGVFKPKSEEPYSELNPKYGKWCQRKCCPCCFGRTCLLPNQGFISEAGASLVSDWLGLNVVPKTKVVWLASDTFNYTPFQRAKLAAKREIYSKTPKIGRKFKRLELPLKIGSFQTFVKDHKPADTFLRQWSVQPLPKQSMEQFQFLFEKLVILDYVIRNTDRGNDNWLIKVEVKEHESCGVTPTGGGGGDLADSDWRMIDNPVVHVAAIDNGLAFPYKHPDSWRSYPFQWAWLQPYADQPFSQRICDQVLPLISDLKFIESLTSELEKIFRLNSEFSVVQFERQMSVLRGQLMNVVEALNKRLSPADLVKLPLRIVERRRYSPPPRPDDNTQPPPHSFQQLFRLKFHYKKPFFSWC